MNTSSDIILEMQHIRKTFPGVVALDEVHFELRRGEVHVLLGENGAGKSTLVKILSGAYQKTSGRIVLHGRETEIHNPHHAQELGIGIIYQEFNLVPQLSAVDNIFLGREQHLPSGLIDQKRLAAAAQEVLDELGVKIDTRCPVGELGVAQQQMVEVAKALSQDAKILIMDEPTSALTEHEIKQLFTAIRQLKTQGVSIIYISHRLEELFEIGDRVTVLRDGKYIGTEQISDVTKSQLITMMANRELKAHFPKEKAARGDEVLKVSGLVRKGALDDINFSLYRGEVLGIAGLLGSGRTELARALFGIDRMDAGQIFINGKPEKIGSPKQAIDLGIGFLTEDRKSQGLIMALTVKDNICLPSVAEFARLGFVDGRAENEAADRFVRDLRIKTPGLNQQVMYLSGGNQQKVVISKWLCCQADILIFDEPTRGIDVGSKVEIYQLMNQLTARGAAIMMISSELPEILGMSDRIAVMSRGSIVGEFSAGEATQESILQCALGVT
ncbi:MAG: sugar ABC transporter ATP-binding protein [Fidelibacterota bacterium]|nr:MAG: sugar ABC transporter ATP-binding protein [Candidatus Neomarinimicrobiota bacterium]